MNSTDIEISSITKVAPKSGSASSKAQMTAMIAIGRPKSRRLAPMSSRCRTA
jgi:hypothetical protein